MLGPVGYYLNATSVLKKIALSVLDHTPTLPSLKEIRCNRDAYPNYFFNLAAHCIRRK